MSATELIEKFDEFLDDIYGTVKVAEGDYLTSEVLKSVDPIYYRTLFLDWMDSENIEISDSELEDLNKILP